MRLIDANKLEEEMQDKCIGDCGCCTGDCPAYIQPTAIDLVEHDKQIRVDLIDKVLEQVKCYLTDNLQLENATKYGNKNAKQMENSYSTVMKYEIAMCVEDFVESIEQLKGGDRYV